MGYKYQAASTFSAPSSRPAASSCVHSAPVATEDSSAYPTHDHLDAAQSPRVQSSCGSSQSDRSVRFADKPVFEPQVPYQPHHRAGSPSSQTSSTPSLSHSADSEHDDDVKCPSTPEFKPTELDFEVPTDLPACSPSPSTISGQNMPYKYEAASISTQAASISARSSWQPTSSCVHSAPVATEDGSAYPTRDHWDAAQSPRVQSSCGSSRSDRSVRFADKPVFEPPVPYQPHHRAGSPSSQTSSTPSLSHSTDSEHDDMECPLTPESKPVELGLEAKPSKSCLSKRKSEPHPAHLAAYSTIEQIVHEFDAYVVAFERPSELDFEAPTADLSVVPALSFTAKNRPLFEHVQNLEALQTELYGIRSYGDHGIRKAHNEAVVMIRHELDWLKRVQARIWNKLMHEQPKRSCRRDRGPEVVRSSF